MVKRPAKKPALRILFLEDAVKDLKSIERELRNADLEFEGRKAATKHDFRAALDNFQPDLILSDYDLPHFDGFSAMAISQKKCHEVPFIFVSGRLDEETAIEALKRGATDYVPKNRLERLPFAVNRALKESREHRLVDEALGRKEKQAELRRAIKDVDELLIRVRNERELFSQICRKVAKVSWLKFVWIGMVEEGTYDIKPAAWAGEEQGYLSTIKVRWDNSRYGRGPAGVTVREARAVVIPDVAHDQLFKPWRKEALERGFLSRASIPLLHARKAIGALSVFSGELDAFGDEEVSLLRNVAGDIAAGVSSLRLQKIAAENERKFRRFVEGLPEAIYVVDAKGKPVYESKKSEQLLRMPISKLGPKVKLGALAARYHVNLSGTNQPYPRAKAPAVKALKGQAATIDDAEIVAGKKRIPIEISSAPIRDEKGKVIYAVTTLRDITERKQARRALVESEKKYRQLVETAQEGVWVVDENLRTTFVNGYMAKMLGYSVEELIGTQPRRLLSPSQLKAARKSLPRIKSQPVAQYEAELVKKNGERMWARVTMTTARDPEGRFTGAVGFVSDVTAHKEADEKGQRLYSLLVATRSISQSLIRVKDERELYQQICNALKNVWYIKFVWIGLVQKNTYHVLPVAQAGLEKGYLSSIKVTWDDSKYGRGPTGMAIKTGKPFVMKDIENDPRFAAWRREARKRGYASSLAVPIIHRGEVIACCNLYSAEKGVFGNEEVEFLLEVAADVAFGVKALRMQEQLKQSEKRFEQFIEGLPMAVLVLDAKGHPVFASKKEKDLVGKEIEELPRDAGLEDLARFYGVQVAGTGQLYPMKKAPLAKALAGEIASTDDMEIRRDQKLIPVQVSAAPVFNEKGEVVYAVATTQDITERKQKERELAEEKELLAITLRSIDDGVITTDMKGKITALNRMAEKLTGVAAEEAVGEPLPRIFRIVDEKTSTIQKVAYREGGPFGRAPEAQNQALLMARDGLRRIIEYNSALMRDDQGRVIGAVLVFRDVTEKRRMEEELLAKTRLDSISVLSGGIAHDFNNILMGVSGNISLAKVETNPGTEIYQYLDGAGKAVQRAKDLTQQLLTFSRGGLPVKKAASIQALIRESASFILSGSKSKAEFVFPDELWAVEVDEGQISQVFNNLIINADQAMLQGGTITIGAENIILAADNELELPAGRYVKIFIQDQGIGIAKQDAGRIFDPFFTVKEHGTGLGLPISNAIVKNHNGKIEFKSEPGVGSIFYVYLPASEKEAELRTEEESALSVGHGKILLMDDMESVREIAGKMLARIGYEMEFVTDGAAAIQAYQKAMEQGEPFDAVIMDLTIPGGMGGKEAIKRLLELDPKLKAIASSGYPNDPGIAESKKFGFKATIIKPYEVKDLSETLRKVLRS